MTNETDDIAAPFTQSNPGCYCCGLGDDDFAVEFQRNFLTLRHARAQLALLLAAYSHYDKDAFHKFVFIAAHRPQQN